MRAAAVHPEQLALRPQPRVHGSPAHLEELDLLREAVLSSRADAELAALPHARPCRCGARAWGYGRHCCRCGREQAAPLDQYPADCRWGRSSSAPARL